MSAQPQLDQAVLLLGPTASGKSALAMQLAQKLQQDFGRTVELISIDSAQVYVGLDIGAAKPTAAERQDVAHHLLDLRDPALAYSAADFVVDATEAVRQIQGRGNLPLIVGGTMMYARALREGIADLPSADPEVRARIENEARLVGWPAMHQRLQTRDPITAQRLAPADRQRIGRALEVLELSGKPLSAWLGREQTPPLPLHTITLHVQDRARLHQRIAERFDLMLSQGFLDEVKRLYQRPDLHPDLPAIRSVGYRQAWAYLAGQLTFEQCREQAIAATRQLAKRQITWIRSMQDASGLDPFGPEPLQALTQLIKPWWGLS